MLDAVDRLDRRHQGDSALDAMLLFGFWQATGDAGRLMSSHASAVGHRRQAPCQKPRRGRGSADSVASFPVLPPGRERWAFSFSAVIA